MELQRERSHDTADRKTRRIAEFIRPPHVTPGPSVTRAEHLDPACRAGVLDEEQGEEFVARGVDLLSEHQEGLATATCT